MSDETKAILEGAVQAANHSGLRHELGKATRDLKAAATATAGGIVIAAAGHVAATMPDSSLTALMVDAQKIARVEDASPKNLADAEKTGEGIALLAGGIAAFANRNRKRYQAAKGELTREMQEAGVEFVSHSKSGGYNEYKMPNGTMLEVPTKTWAAKVKPKTPSSDQER